MKFFLSVIIVHDSNSHCCCCCTFSLLLWREKVFLSPSVGAFSLALVQVFSPSSNTFFSRSCSLQGSIKTPHQHGSRNHWWDSASSTHYRRRGRNLHFNHKFGPLKGVHASLQVHSKNCLEDGFGFKDCRCWNKGLLV